MKMKLEKKPANIFQKPVNDGKQILRDAMAKYVPQNIVKASKQGFSSPDASWFKGQSIEFVSNLLLNNNARLYDLLDQRAVKNLIEEHLSGKVNRRLLIWSLLNV